MLRCRSIKTQQEKKTIMDCDSIEICLVSNLTLLFIIQSLSVPKDSEKKRGQQPETDVMDQFLDPETDPERQFLNPETDVKCQFLDKKNSGSRNCYYGSVSVSRNW